MNPGTSVRLDEDERRRRVHALLARHGTTPDDVLPYVSGVFGAPGLIVATGSVPAGYGNENSDCDLYAVVPQSQLSQLPIPAVQDHLRVDVRYFSAPDLERYPEHLAAPWPAPGGPVGRKAFNERRTMLEAAVRFAVGVPLVGHGPWPAWKAAIEGPELTGAVVGWWALEARRQLVAATWLEDGSMACAYRHAAALHAALHVETARRGHLFFGSKWLSEKLRQLADPALVELFQRSFEYPMTAATRQAIATFAREVSDPDAALEVGLELAPGCETYRCLGRTFVSRWQLRAVELDDEHHQLETDGTSALWHGGEAAAPPPTLAELFAADFLWLTIGVSDGAR